MDQSPKLPEGSSESTPAQEIEKVEQGLEQLNPSVFKGIDRSKRRAIASTVVQYGQQFFAKFHSGPLPMPTDMEEYEQVLPGSADRIVKMAEKQNGHRIWVEKLIAVNQVIQTYIGQACALGIGIFGIAKATELGLAGKETTACVIGGATLIALVTAFLSSKSSQRKSINQKKADQ